MSEPPIRRVRGLNDPPIGTDQPNAEPAPTPAPDLTHPPAAPKGPIPSGPRADRERRDEEAPARTERDVDDEIDREIERSVGRRASALDDVNFKRQKDDEVEAELEAVLAGFDPATLSAGTGPRTRAQDRAGQPRSGIGQEEREGIQQAKVVGIKGNTVFLDLGAKSEGIVPLDQFGEHPPNVGEVVEVVFDRYDADEGLLVMSRQGAAVAATWANLKKGLIVEARVTKAIKGGLEVEVNGIRGFLPISQVEMGRVDDVTPYLNQRLKCLVTEANPRERNLVVSRRDLLEKERAEQREKTWAELEEGQTRTGVVRNLKPFGAFVDLGGVDGLVPVGEMSWGRVNDPSEVVKLGQEVEVRVLRIDRAAQKVTLGLKQLKASPWDTVEDRFDVGQHARGRVTRLMDFGAFVELEPGLEGLIHISEMGPKKVWRVKDVVQEGQEVEVRILRIEPESRRMSLSLKPLPAEPVPEPEEDEADAAPPAPKPERAVPLRGGLGDRDPNPFGLPPR
jgi:predicted RNA-binding protein with RPS1 domain